MGQEITCVFYQRKVLGLTVFTIENVMNAYLSSGFYAFSVKVHCVPAPLRFNTGLTDCLMGKQ